jgi:hypothetical protein
MLAPPALLNRTTSGTSRCAPLGRHPETAAGRRAPTARAFARASTTALAGQGGAAGIGCASVVGVELHMHPDFGVCSIGYNELRAVLLLRRRRGARCSRRRACGMDDRAIWPAQAPDRAGARRMSGSSFDRETETGRRDRHRVDVPIALPTQAMTQPPTVFPEWRERTPDLVLRTAPTLLRPARDSQWRARRPSTTAAPRSRPPGSPKPTRTRSSPRKAAATLASAARPARESRGYCWRRA